MKIIIIAIVLNPELERKAQFHNNPPNLIKLPPPRMGYKPIAAAAEFVYAEKSPLDLPSCIYNAEKTSRIMNNPTVNAPP